MKSIKMDFTREDDDTGVLQKGRRYQVVKEASPYRQFEMPLNQIDFLDLLVELRYDAAINEDKRKAALERLSQVVTQILEPPPVPPGTDMMQIDLLTNARELWALPFEAALGPDGQPLFVQELPAVVLTRRAPQEFKEHQPGWPARPRILFAHASPRWVKAPAVPASAHKEALLQALQPWVEPFPNLPVVVGKEESVLTTLADASLSDIAAACRNAEAEKKPYTHVHILAHGVVIKDPIREYRKHYGIALRADDQQPTETEALVQALRPPRASEQAGQELPLVVTLAICDGGNATNTLIEAGGLAQEIHRAGVPIVVASQLPLTFPGSEILTREFYKAWMSGDDVRAALHKTRVALYKARNGAHDWVSLVAYVRLLEGYGDYLFNVRLVSQLAALETASNYAKHLIDNDIIAPEQYQVVADRLQGRIVQLEAFLSQGAVEAGKTKKEVEQENAGLLGSAYKRLAELFSWRAKNAVTDRAAWLTQSRAALEKARDTYRNGFRRNPSHHWSGVQYLALDAILTGQISNIGEWYACQVAAKLQLEEPQSTETDRIWALGSIAELNLIAPLAPRVEFHPEDAAQALTDLHCRVLACPPGTFPELSPIVSTRRQLQRYIDWWTKANGYFGEGVADLVDEAKKLAELLAE